MMMNKKDSSQYHLLRYLVLGGIVGIALLSLNVSRAGNIHNIAAKLHFTTDTVPPPPPPPPPAPVPPPPPPPEVKQVKFAKPKPVKAPAAPAKAAAPAPEVITMEAGKAETGDRPAGTGINFRKNADGTAAAEGNPLYVVDGVTVLQGTPDIKPEDIASISVIKDDAAKSLYGEGGKNGVVLITSKKQADKQKLEAVKIMPKELMGKGVQPVYYINGKPATNSDKISPADVESIDVYKGEAAVAKYGSAAVNGVVDVKMKVK